MNDRFKFRVWNEKHGRYIQDNEYPIGGDYSLSMTQYGYVEVIGLGDYQDYSDDIHSWGVVKNLEDYIGDCVVEQCTGLKDKNGKLIYEGDIVIKSDVSAIGYSRTRLCEVHWHNDWLSWAITTQYGDTYELSEFEPQQYEIIGNIHENADLLEINDD